MSKSLGRRIKESKVGFITSCKSVARKFGVLGNTLSAKKRRTQVNILWFNMKNSWWLRPISIFVSVATQLVFLTAAYFCGLMALLFMAYMFYSTTTPYQGWVKFVSDPGLWGNILGSIVTLFVLYHSLNVSRKANNIALHSALFKEIWDDIGEITLAKHKLNEFVGFIREISATQSPPRSQQIKSSMLHIILSIREMKFAKDSPEVQTHLDRLEVSCSESFANIIPITLQATSVIRHFDVLVIRDRAKLRQIRSGSFDFEKYMQ